MDKYIIKICKYHGETSFVLEGRGYYRCRKCRSEGVQRRRNNIKKKAVEYKGGKCISCGYNKCIQALGFHHKDPKGKDFGISEKGYTRSWKKVKEELDKCDLYCNRCHTELHAKLRNTPE